MPSSYWVSTFSSTYLSSASEKKLAEDWKRFLSSCFQMQPSLFESRAWKYLEYSQSSFSEVVMQAMQDSTTVTKLFPLCKRKQYVVVIELPSHAAKVFHFLGPLLPATQPPACEDLLCTEPEPWVFLEQADDDLFGGKLDFLPELPQLGQQLPLKARLSFLIFQKVQSLVLPLKGFFPEMRVISTIPTLHISHLLEQTPSMTSGAMQVWVPIFSLSFSLFTLISFESPKSISRMSTSPSPPLFFFSRMLSSFMSLWITPILCRQLRAPINWATIQRTVASPGARSDRSSLERVPPSQCSVTMQQFD